MEVLKYPLASFGSVKKSALNLSVVCNRPCFHSQYVSRSDKREHFALKVNFELVELSHSTVDGLSVAL